MSIIDGKRIIITGGTGSLGQKLVERFLSGQDGEPESITVYSRDELKQANMLAAFPDRRLIAVIGDVRDYYTLKSVLWGADIVIHAAAMKRVESCESSPDEAIATNVIGASNIVRAVRELQDPPGIVVGVSSDKGCAPVNVYGATKFLQEKRFLRGNSECKDTRFVCVCYGNVMASRGSVIPTWQNAIAQGGPVKITDPNMTRFLISLDQAVDTILFALTSEKGGEVYIPCDLPAARIGDIADVLMDGECVPVKVTGKGAGEKMDETLVTDLEANRTIKSGGYYVVTQKVQPKPALTREYVSCDHLVSKSKLRELFIQQGFIAERKGVLVG